MHSSTIARGLMFAALTLAVAACGGAPAASQRASQPAASLPLASVPAATTAGQTPAPPVAGDACGLASVAEVSAALGTNVVTATATPGSSSSVLSSVLCDYATADGTVALNVSLLGGSAIDTTYSNYANSGGAVPVPGIGDAAVLTTYNTLFIKTGGNVIGISPLIEFDSPQELIAAVTPLALSAISRL